MVTKKNMNVWHIQAYELVIPNGDGTTTIPDWVEVIVEAENEEGALEEAKKMVTRKNYRAIRVYRKPERDNLLSDEMRMKSLEIQAKILKSLGIK